LEFGSGRTARPSLAFVVTEAAWAKVNKKLVFRVVSSENDERGEEIRRRQNLRRKSVVGDRLS
jgi:hypothetical protein